MKRWCIFCGHCDSFAQADEFAWAYILKMGGYAYIMAGVLAIWQGMQPALGPGRPKSLKQ